jgi:hypothetical protein
MYVYALYEYTHFGINIHDIVLKKVLDKIAAGWYNKKFGADRWSSRRSKNKKNRAFPPYFSFP